MKNIGGNITAEIQVFTSVENEIGEYEKSWTTAKTITGFLDMRSGDSKYQSYDTKLEESTHIFLADFTPLDGITAENSRMLIKGKVYDIMLIDNVMELDEHYEIYLKLTGGV